MILIFVSYRMTMALHAVPFGKCELLRDFTCLFVTHDQWLAVIGGRIELGPHPVLGTR